MAILTVFIVGKLDAGYQHQKIEVRELAHVRLSQQLTLQAKLFSNVLDYLTVRTRDTGFTVAASQALREALEAADSTKVSQVLARVVKTSQFDSMVALGPEMNVLGTYRLNMSPTKVLELLDYSLISRARGIAIANDHVEPYAYSDLERAEEETLRALGIEVSDDQLSIVSLHPVFNSKGNVLAVLLGHRLITPGEPAIHRVDETGDVGLRIINDEQILLSSRLEDGEHLRPRGSSLFRMGETIGGTYLYKCLLVRSSFRVCVYKPELELEVITKGLVSFIKTENEALVRWLLGLGATIMVLSVLSIWIMSTRIMAPLRQLTYAVHSVAKGNWLADVGWIKRSDEVGEIARAVSVLQRSMKERERLRSDVVQFEQLKSQRSDMEKVLHDSQGALRQCLFNLSDLVESVELGNKNIVGMVGVAVGDVDETRLVTNRLLVACPEAVETFKGTSKDPESVVLENFDRLGNTIGALKSGTQNMSRSVVKLIQEAQSADRIVKQLMNSVHAENEVLVGTAVKNDPD